MPSSSLAPRAVCPSRRPATPSADAQDPLACADLSPWAVPAWGRKWVAAQVPATRKPGLVLLLINHCPQSRVGLGHLCEFRAQMSLPPILLPSFQIPFLSSSLPFPFPPFLPPSFPHFIHMSQAPAKHEGHKDGLSTEQPSCSPDQPCPALPWPGSSLTILCHGLLGNPAHLDVQQQQP